MRAPRGNTMDIAGLQRAIGATPDGKWGPASRAALLDKFSNRGALAISTGQMQAFADRLGVSLRQLAAVAKVESSGAAFDSWGRPKILFERHIFHRQTDGRWSVCSFSNPQGGGYGEDSWDKLLDAAGKSPDAAFAACSWGRYQVLGAHWSALGYSSSYALAASTATSEAAHYDLLCRFIEKNGMKAAMQAISSDPADCKAFARGYNGPSYQTFDYHLKLARAMR